MKEEIARKISLGIRSDLFEVLANELFVWYHMRDLGFIFEPIYIMCYD